jgi:hypothetical protein
MHAHTHTQIHKCVIIYTSQAYHICVRIMLNFQYVHTRTYIHMHITCISCMEINTFLSVRIKSSLRSLSASASPSLASTIFRICPCVCMYVCMYICTCLCLCVCSMFMYVCMYLPMCKYVLICMYLCVCTYMTIHTHLQTLRVNLTSFFQ